MTACICLADKPTAAPSTVGPTTVTPKPITPTAGKGCIQQVLKLQLLKQSLLQRNTSAATAVVTLLIDARTSRLVLSMLAM
jgi:hypothetical protein